MFGSVIRKYRLKKGYSVDEFSDLMHLSNRLYRYIENNQRNITLENFKLFSSVLDFSLLITKGEILIMDNEESLVKEKGDLISEIKKDLIVKFKHLNYIELGNMIGAVIDFVEKEYNTTVTWRGLGYDIENTKKYAEKFDTDSFTKSNLIEIYTNVEQFRYWTFEFEIDKSCFALSLEFDISNPDTFIEIFDGYIMNELYDSDITEKCNIDEVIYECNRHVMFDTKMLSDVFVKNIKLIDKVYV